MKSNINETTPSLDRLAIAASQHVKERDYWLKKLSGGWNKTGYPYDYNKKTGSETEMARHSFRFSSRLSILLLRLSKGSDIRLHMISTAGLAVLLYRILETGMPADKNRDENIPGRDIIIGSPIAKSGAAADYINTVLVLRNFITPLMTFKELLIDVQQTTAEALENKNYPVEILAQQLNRPISPGRDFPLFDIALLVENIHDKKYLRHINIDMIISLERMGESISGAVEYNASLYKSSTIERMIGHWMWVLTGGLSHIDTPVCSLDILSRQEKQQLLIDFNAGATGYPKNKTIRELFSQQAHKTPNQPALVDKRDAAGGVGETRSFTYRQLEEQASRLAGTLISRGVSPDRLVGIITEPSWEMIVGILAILMTGSGYVPLNPRSPWTRNRYLLEDCRVKILLAASKTLTPTDFHGETLCIDTWEKENTSPANGAARVISSSKEKPADTFAYVIFTSGSTGVPKGVPVTHANFSPLVHWGKKSLGLGQRDRVLQNLSYYFDWSVWEIFITLTTGAALYTAPLRILSDPVSQADFIDKNQITTLHITPTQYSYLADLQRPLESLSYLFIGAEKLTYDLVHRSFSLVGKHCRVFNMYGPTEATIISAVLEISRDSYEEYKDLSSVPIGKPVGNETLLVLDKYFNLCPLRVPGELYIGGDNVVYGYLNNPELTAEKFIVTCSDQSDQSDSSDRSDSSNRLYKTGDLARWLPEGSIEFLGRLDFQVKIRGFRIELGEIENRLLSHKQIKEAVVTARQEENREEYYLTAYVVMNGPWSEPDLRGYLSQRLPDYMVPAYLIFLDRLPLTPNGKLDRKALPEPDIQAGKEYIAPRDEVEERVAGIWSGILGIDKHKISIDTDFFQLGGHSLRATTLVYQVYKEFQVNMEIEDVFVHPTIRELAQRIKSMKTVTYKSIRVLEQKEFYPAAYSQKRLWLLNRDNPRAATFNMAGVIALDFDVDILLVKKVLNLITRRHDSLRTGFKVISNQLVQVIKKEMEIPFKMEDLSSLQQPGKENKKQEIYSRELEAPFDLQQIPLSRAALLKLAERKYELLFNMHHIISDGWSIEILKHEFNTLYDAYKKGKPGDIDIQPLEIQYKDYTGWQNQLLANEEKMAEAKEFWKDYLAGPLPVLNLPYDFTHYPGRTASSAYRWVVPGSLADRLRKLASDHHASLFMVLLAGFNTLLSQVTAQEDIILAIPAAARQHDALKNIVGLFVNTLILRSKISGEESFMDFFKHSRDNAFKILDHQDIPLELIFSQLKIKYPAISVFFNMINIGSTHQQTLTLLESRHTEKVQDTKFDLVCYVSEYKNGIEINCHYFKDRFKPRSIEKLMDFYKKILESIGGDPGKKLKEYRFTTKKKTLKRHN